MVKSFRDLLAWQRSMLLAEAAYSVAGALPRHESYGLSGQIRHHLSIALGSLAELQTLLLLAGRVYGIDTVAVVTLVGGSWPDSEWAAPEPP